MRLAGVVTFCAEQEPASAMARQSEVKIFM
jgi:hypothetical protein